MKLFKRLTLIPFALLLCLVALLVCGITTMILLPLLLIAIVAGVLFAAGILLFLFATD